MDGEKISGQGRHSHETEPIAAAHLWGWIGELPPSSIRTVAPVSHELWRRGSEWVNRRVETIELLDVDTVRVRLSIDFRIPTQLPGAEKLAEETYFLPLTVLQRRTSLAYFDLRDEGGAAVPLLTRQENARLTGGMLVSAARLALRGEKGLELEAALVAYLATIPTKPRVAARVFVQSVLDPNNRLLYPNPRVAEVLLADPEFRDLLGLCAICSFIHVPVTAAAGERKIIKISLLSPWGAGGVASQRGKADSRVRRWGRAVSTWIGWRAETRYLFMPQIGNAESFHLQIEAPPRVEFTEAGTRSSRAADLVKQEAASAPTLTPLPSEERRDEVGYQQFVAGIAKRKHLYVELSHAHRTGVAWVRFRVVRHGFLRAAMAVAWLTALLLGLFALRADNVLGEAQTASALLLLVPALIAGFLIGPGEHAMTRHLLRGPRGLTAAVGLLALIATAALLTLPEPQASAAPESLVTIWTLEAIAAALLAILLTIGSFLPRAASAESATPPVAHDEAFIGPQTEAEATGDADTDGNV